MLRGRMHAARLDVRTRYRLDTRQWPDRASMKRNVIVEGVGGGGGGGEEAGL
jgi:hypothetical protein